MLSKSLLNRNPFDVAREMDRLFESMVGSPRMLTGFAPRWTFPAVNVWEDEGHLVAEAEIPGMKLEDIEVSVTGDELTVRGEREIATPENGNVLRRERASGRFERTIGLPCEIDPEQVEATLQQGILSIRMPKAATCQPRRIQVKSS